MSNVTKQGFVKKVFTNEGTNQRGAWFAKSFKIEDENGTEDSFFYQLGFNKACPFSEGDYIKFEATPKDDRAMEVVEGSGSLVKNPPAKSASADQSSNSGGSGKGRGNYSGGAKTKTSELFGEIGGYNTEDDIRRMSHSAARSDAVRLVTALLDHKALPMSEAQSKAGVTKRFDEITKMVDKFTVKFFFDSASGRILDEVADAGEVDYNVDVAIPDGASSVAAQQEPAPTPSDAGLPEDDDVSF